MLSRRTFVSLAAASAAAPGLASAQPAPREVVPPGQKEPVTGFYEKSNVRIRYQEVGSGFPLLVTPGGGLNSRISNWVTAVFNAPEGIVKLTDRGRLFPAPLGLSGQHIRRAKEFPDPSWRATDTRSIPRPLKLTMPNAGLRGRRWSASGAGQRWHS
jgi:hypothetical protein